MVALILTAEKGFLGWRLGPAEHLMGTINGRDGDKAAEAAMLHFGRFLDQTPFLRGVVRKHLGSQW